MNATPETATGINAKAGQPLLIDGNVIQWFAWKDTARAGAKAIGWPMKCIYPVMTRFQYGYALHQEHGGFLTKAAYSKLHAERNPQG